MSKNKIMWNIAIILLALIVLPIVYAQTQINTSSRILLILINAAVIGIVLFIVQSFLLPNKPDKERVSAWIIVIIASLLIAFLYGRDGFIWQVGPLSKIFDIHVLVNTAIIGSVIYFIFGFLKGGEKLKSPEGNTGYIIIIILISLVISVKIGNRWVWEQTIVRSLYNYLFIIKDGYGGILNPYAPHYKLWVLIGSFTLLAFFFEGYLLKGGVAGSKKMIYALSLVMAVSMADQGATPWAVLQLGEFIFVILLWQSLQETVGKENQWIALFLAIVIITWISAAVTTSTPEYRPFLGKIGCNFMNCKEAAAAAGIGPGTGGILGKIGKTSLIFIGLIVLALLIFTRKSQDGKAKKGAGILLALVLLGLLWWIMPTFALPLLIPFLVIGILLYLIIRGETRSRVLTLGMRGLKKRANAIFRTAAQLENWAENREPPVMRENRLLLHAIVNYTVRSEITYRYYGFVEQAKRVGEKVIREKIEKHTNKDILRHDLIVTRSGGVTEEEHATFEGWNRLNVEVVDLVNEFFETLYLTYIEMKLEFKTPSNVNMRFEVNLMESIKSRADDIKAKIGSNKQQYDDRMKAFGGHHVLDAYREIVLGMTNVTGEILQHPQLFAKPGAAFDMNDYGAKDKIAGHDAKGLPTDEVNQFGEVIADINEEKKKQENYDRFGNLKDPRLYKKPRKVKHTDIIPYPNYEDWGKNIEHDWVALAEDIRYGLFHPESRTYKMYEKALDHGVFPEWRDDEIPLTIEGVKLSSPPVKGDEAFDARAMANLGKNVYWGRDTFYTESPPKKDSPFHNPYPLVTSGGLKRYLRKRFLVSAQDPAKMLEMMKIIPADTMASRKIVKAHKVEVPIGTNLADTSSPESAEGK